MVYRLLIFSLFLLYFPLNNQYAPQYGAYPPQQHQQYQQQVRCVFIFLPHWSQYFNFVYFITHRHLRHTSSINPIRLHNRNQYTERLYRTSMCHSSRFVSLLLFVFGLQLWGEFLVGATNNLIGRSFFYMSPLNLLCNVINFVCVSTQYPPSNYPPHHTQHPQYNIYQTPVTPVYNNPPPHQQVTVTFCGVCDVSLWLDAHSALDLTLN